MCVCVCVCVCVCAQRPVAAEYRCFDLLAVQPTTEKLFHVRFTDTLHIVTEYFHSTTSFR